MNICSRAIPDMFVAHSRYVQEPMNIGSLFRNAFGYSSTNLFSTLLGLIFNWFTLEKSNFCCGAF